MSDRPTGTGIGPLLPSSRRRDLGLRIAVLFGLALLSVFAHRGWFRPGMIAFGDWRYLVGDTTQDLFDFPRAWDATRDFGRANGSLQAYPFLFAVGLLDRLGAGFSVAERLVFFFPFTFLPFAAMAALTRRFTPSYVAVVVSSSLYALNTYALMVGNNQLTVAMAYAFAPWIAARALDLGTSTATRPLPRVLADGGALILVTVAAAIYEPRITLLGLAVAGGALLVAAIDLRARATRVAAVVIGLGVPLLATQAYWLLSGLGASGYVSTLLPQNPFISFATITHALNLNHPFWRFGPPSVFAQEQPMAVLFLLPALIFVALAVAARRDLRLAYFGGVAFLGAFLVKGANPPFPRFYGWAFDVVPGMRLYRDMSKFSLWTALGYSIVLGVFSAHAVQELMRGARKTQIMLAGVLATVALVILVPAAPALTQQQQGTFREPDYPTGLRMVHEIVEEDETFGRVLWVGVDDPFLYRTRLHPQVSVTTALEVLRGAAAPGVDGLFSRAGFEELGRRGVSYVVIGRAAAPWPGANDTQRRQARDRLTEQAQGHADLHLNRDGYRLYRLRSVARLWSTSKSCGQPAELPSKLSASSYSVAKVQLHEPAAAFAVTYLQAFDAHWALKLNTGEDASLSHRRTQDGFNCWNVHGARVGEFTARATFTRDRRTAQAGGVSLLTVVLVTLGTVVLGRLSRRTRSGQSTFEGMQWSSPRRRDRVKP